MQEMKTQDILKQLSNPYKIRNIAIIGHQKSCTLPNLLNNYAGIPKPAQQQDQIKTDQNISYLLYHNSRKNMKQENEQYEHQCVINLMEPLTQYNSNIANSVNLRLVDSALIIIDAMVGVTHQIENALRQCWRQKVKPLVFIDKLDQFMDFTLSNGIKIYERLQYLINEANMHHSDNNDEKKLNISQGDVIFGSIAGQWAFSIPTFAQIYHEKLDISEQKLRQKFWGQHYYSAEQKIWKNTKQHKQTIQIAFLTYVIDPINKFRHAVLKSSKDDYLKMAQSLKIQIKQVEEHQHKNYANYLMNKWLPLQQPILQTFLHRSPSPIQAQKLKIDRLVSKQQSNFIRDSVINCDKNGPLLAYCTRIIPTTTNPIVIARIFSGTSKVGEMVSILGENFQKGKNFDCKTLTLKGVGVVIAGNLVHCVDQICCGNLVVFMGIDSYILKTATLTNWDKKDINKMIPIYKPMNPLCKIHVKPKFAQNLPKFVNGLQKLCKFESYIDVKAEDTGQFFISGHTKQQVMKCLDQFKQKYAQCQIETQSILPIYKESISVRSQKVITTKSPNKFLHLIGSAQPFLSQIVSDFDQNYISLPTTIAQFSEAQKNKLKFYGLGAQVIDKIWGFGPIQMPANILVDQTIGVDRVEEIKDGIASAFQWACRQGCLCQQSLRKVRYNLCHSILPQNKSYRGQGQIIPAARRMFLGLQLASQPCLLQPRLSYRIFCRHQSAENIKQLLNNIQADIMNQYTDNQAHQLIIGGYLPMTKSFQVEEAILMSTGGKGFIQLYPESMWHLVGNPYESESAKDTVLNIRRYKGIKLQLPIVSDYEDR